MRPNFPSKLPSSQPGSSEWRTEKKQLFFLQSYEDLGKCTKNTKFRCIILFTHLLLLFDSVQKIIHFHALQHMHIMFWQNNQSFGLQDWMLFLRWILKMVIAIIKSQSNFGKLFYSLKYGNSIEKLTCWSCRRRRRWCWGWWWDRSSCIFWSKNSIWLL